MRKIFFISLIAVLFVAGSCKKFLDIVPDNTPVIDQAFSLRVMAQRFLATCYNRLPSNTYLGGDRYLLADEFWLNSTSNFSSGSYPAWYIAMGQQNANSPLLNYWGSNASGAYWQGINDCNILIERVNEVPDMAEPEKEMWAAEAKVLKAYYHFLLLRAYGPIIIRDKNLSVYGDQVEMQEPRQPVDQCFDYIVNTIDEAMPLLMPIEENGNLEIGRITQIVAKSIKAMVLVEAASPLFNGNTDQALLKDENGDPLFNQTYDASKWERAAIACKDAIDFAASNGKKLHTWVPAANLTIKNPSTFWQMNLRTAVNESDGNAEALWFDTRSVGGGGFQAAFTPRGFHPNTVSNAAITSFMGATLNMAEKFYSKNGVPIEEDITYPYQNRYELVTVPSTDAYQFDLQANYNTIHFHLDREPRFYGTLSFDGGRYFMMSELSDEDALNTNYTGRGNIKSFNVVNNQITGYMVKKYVNAQNSYGGSNAYSARPYAIPIIRLADLYLLYAEAVNEFQGPSPEVYQSIDSVRARSGLGGVVSSWQQYSSQPNKPASKDGLREIIKRERTIELAFEGKRFWDLRRWKDAVFELNTLILGWDVKQRLSAAFYRPNALFSRTFTTKDYFWPISLDEMRRNPKLKQNLGW
ncbi:RagB/SusD family nutrient uptake outer membrane protein [Niabella insulamsoli]|uniref:RagB/SusD family nutrient uptake outer membrane protein n=1 Tax=Niabella insulamsoli TaxID=3144874 RepID=UPI0031FCACA8